MANGQQISRYPVMGGPQLSSVISRQRMYMDDAMYAMDKQKERQLNLAKTGGKGFVEYDKMLRGFMEAKYANPNLTFWDYVSKPSVGAAFRKQGRDIIAEETIKGGEVEGLGFGARHKAGLKGIFGKDNPVTEETAKEIAGMAGGVPGTKEEVFQRQVARTRKIYEEGVQPTTEGADPTLAAMKERLTSGTAKMKETAGVAEKRIKDIMAMEPPPETSPREFVTETWAESTSGPGRIKAGAVGKKPEGGLFKTTFDPATGSYKRTLETNVSMRGGKLYRMGGGGGLQGTHIGDVEMSGMPVFSRPIAKGKDVVGSAQIFKFTDPEGASSYYEAASKGTNYDLLRRIGQDKFLTAAGADFDPRAMEHLGMKKLDIDVSAMKDWMDVGGRSASDYFKSHEFTKAHPVPEISGEVAGEAAKGGLKSALGIGAKGIGYGYSLASGISNISKGQTAEARAGGALQAAGGAAGLVAMTNFWNPVGWAAAIPAALSLTGTGVSMSGGKGGDPLSRTPLGRYRRRVGIV